VTLTAAPTAKVPSGTFLDLVLELPAAGCGAAAARAAWFLVRNLAFAHEAKAHFVANPRALPAVIAALDAADAEVATYASSTLYAAPPPPNPAIWGLKGLDAHAGAPASQDKVRGCATALLHVKPAA